MINQEVKGTLAKLLATENLTVEHRKVSTACFDVDTRLLILPIWKTASNTVYDLLVGHEVGHALYTPNQSYEPAPKAFVNVLEDARIERMMKVTYPGLRKSFFCGYKELWDDDFFGVRDEDMSTLSLIDRINLYYKGNAQIPFTEEEKVWVKRTNETTSFDDVINLAIELYEYACDKQQEKESIPAEVTPDGEKSADKQETVTNEGGELEDEMTHEEMLEEAARREGEWDDERDSDADLETPSYGGTSMDETVSITDAALQESLQSLVDENAKEWIYLSLPKVDVDKCIISHGEIQKELNEWFYTREYGDDETRIYQLNAVDYGIKKYNSYKKSAQKSVNYLVKQFEMKKSADNYKRTAVAKTGVIDTNSLYKYKLTDDIFKKMTITPDGKNHGLIMYLDWSGSMSDVMLDTLKQTFNLVWFCKKAGIPFRVYAFQSGIHSFYGSDKDVHPGFERKDNVLSSTSDFRLLEMFSSRQNARSLEKSMQLVFLQVFSFNGWRLPTCRTYNLGGTPLAEAVLCTRDLVAKIKRLESVQKVNVVALTDGEANPMSFLSPYPEGMNVMDRDFRSNYLCHHHHKVFFLKDPKTGYTRKLNNSPYETTKEIVSFYREITDYNWIGIRICSKAELGRVVRGLPFMDGEAIDKQWKKQRFASIKNEVGFTESFYMPDRGIGMGTQDLEVKTKKEVATKAELARAFKKHMGSKMTNKTILNAFIEQIA